MQTIGRFAFCFSLVLATLVGFLTCLSGRGPRVQVEACVFIVSITTTQLLVRILETPPYNFKFPGLVTLLHILCTWIAILAYWMFSGDRSQHHLKSFMSDRRLLKKVVPISLSMTFAIVFANVALGRIDAGLSTILSSLTPVVTALLSTSMGRSLDRCAWLGLAVALAGAIMVSLSEMKAGVMRDKAAIVGIVSVLSAVMLRALKAVLQDTLLNASDYRSGEGEALVREDAHVSPMHLWMLQAPFMVVASLAFVICAESPVEAVHKLRPATIGVLLASCASATVLNILGATTLKALGATLQQAIGKLNVVLTVSCSVSFLGEVVPVRILIGGCVMLVGVGMFEKAQSLADSKFARKDKMQLPQA